MIYARNFVKITLKNSIIYDMKNLICLFISVLLLVGCAQKEITLTAKDNKKSYDMALGQRIIVDLEGNPTTGYSWEVETINKEVLKQIGEMEHKIDSTLVGAPGISTFRFRTISKGNSVLAFVYKRPWEKDKEPIKRFGVGIRVESFYNGKACCASKGDKE